MNNKDIAEILKNTFNNVNLNKSEYQEVAELIIKLEAKPVYTKAMHEADKWPPVGVNVFIDVKKHFPDLSFTNVPKEELGVCKVIAAVKFSIFVDVHGVGKVVSYRMIRPIETQEEKTFAQFLGIVKKIDKEQYWSPEQKVEYLNSCVTLKAPS